jgi:hypothetical protein
MMATECCGDGNGKCLNKEANGYDPSKSWNRIIIPTSAKRNKAGMGHFQCEQN